MIPSLGANGSSMAEIVSSIPVNPMINRKDITSDWLNFANIWEPAAIQKHHISRGPARPPHTADILYKIGKSDPPSRSTRSSVSQSLKNANSKSMNGAT